MTRIDIEGYTANEILNLPGEQLDAFVLSGRPIVFRAGTAEILGEFKIKGESLIVELAQIDGGGGRTSDAHITGAAVCEETRVKESGVDSARLKLCRT